MFHCFVTIRESQLEDQTKIAELVRQGYSSNVLNAWLNILLNEITFQAIILLAALMFIFMGVPLSYCLLSIPIVIIMMYVIIFGSYLIKAAELINEKRPIMCWVAEVYEPYFSNINPSQNYYQIILNENDNTEIDFGNYRKNIIGTCAVMKHKLFEDGAWLFRLIVDKRYRKKNFGYELTKTVQNWCKGNKFNFIELAVTECQDDARQVFIKAGFQVKQLYHKRLFTSAFVMQMFQLRCEVRSTF